ncbi:hypothetical protein GTA08_BOTSDO05633 [Botryosphaeria dothidea]|uniref:Gtp binding protein n=1 Tax=Botryosphaeria dothidea TaxID=55169 RepID=A0A8H4IV36_9PEZI|nr:hypothetical protein GTA08_BOTSDO05633 [Botryosphaeria dothidea]
MEWPSASQPLSLIKAAKAFFDSPDQEPALEALEGLTARLEELRKGDQPKLWDRLLELLADASRDQKWREPIEKSGLLKYHLENLDPATLPATSSKQLLRAIGNGVADRDESRAVVLPFLDKIISCLQNPALAPVAISVLYNTCLGYEPAQKEAAGLRLDRQLCHHLSNETANVSQVIELLAWVSDNLSEDALSESADCLDAIMQYFPSCEEWEDFKNLIASASVYLQDSIIQSKILHSDGLTKITQMLKLKTEQLPLLQLTLDEEEKNDFLEDLRITTGIVMNTIASITALDDFTRLYDLSSPLIQEQGAWLPASSPILQTCACITLGNIAVSDEINISMVHQHRYHLPTLAILSASPTPDRTLLYLAAGFLRHLAQPAANVEAVSSAGAIPTLAALLSRRETELDFEIAAVLRRLVNHSSANAATLAKDTDTVAKLLVAAKQSKTGFEVGRLLIAIARKLHERQSSSSDDTEMPELWRSLVSHEEVMRPLLLMVRQDQVPALAAEGWFGFGLFAGTNEGARKVADMFADEDDWKVLREAVTKGEEGGANTKNALTAVHLVARGMDEEGEKAKWEALAKEGRDGMVTEIE